MSNGDKRHRNLVDQITQLIYESLYDCLKQFSFAIMKRLWPTEKNNVANISESL